MSNQANHRQFCWQQVDAQQPLFRISRVYAPPEFADRLLALYAFFSAIEGVTATVSDEAVALRKLDWWRNELARMNLHQSAHPIVAELQRSGAAELVPAPLVEELLLVAIKRLDAPAPGSLEEFEALCVANGRAQVRLEMAVCGAGEGVPEAVAEPAVQVGAALLLREAVLRGRFWWVSLELLARHGLSRSQLLSPEHQDSAVRLMEDVFKMEAFESDGSGSFFEDISNKNQIYKHLFVQNTLIRKIFKKLKKTSPVKYGERLSASRVSDAFSAWRAARRFSLSK